MLTIPAYMLILSALFYAPIAAASSWPMWVSIPLFLAGVAHQVISDWRIKRQPCPFGTDKPMDPLDEARVYKSYGRIEQARDVLQTALSQHPERQELKRALADLGGSPVSS